MGKRKRFTDEAAFETCPNCGHTFDDDIVDEDIVQSRYSRFDDDIYDDDEDITQSRFDDLIYDDDLEDDVVQSRYSRRCSRFADDLDDDIRQSRRCSRFADEVIYDDDIIDDEEIDEIRQSRRCSRFDDDVPMSRYSRRCSRFDDIVEDEDGDIDDVVQSRYSRFSDDEMLGEDEDIIQSRYARRCSRFDDEPIDMDEDVIQSRFGRGRRCSRFDDLVYGDEDEVLGDELEDIQQSRYGRRCSRFDDLVDLDENIDIDEDEDIDVDEDVIQSRFGKRCAKRFDDDICQSRKRCSRFDELVDETEDEEVISNELTDAVDNKFGKKFADEVMYDEMPVKNELQVETEKLSAGKKFSLGAAETVSANILKENRELQVQNLLSEGKINRIQAKQILDRFCNQQAISFSVNSGDNSEFKNIIALMKSGIGADYSEKTGVQFALPAESGGNELLQEIERRAAERKG